jgi:hypothetical protein
MFEILDPARLASICQCTTTSKKEAVRLIILQEKPINLKASQSNRLVLRR